MGPYRTPAKAAKKPQNDLDLRKALLLLHTLQFIFFVLLNFIASGPLVIYGILGIALILNSFYIMLCSSENLPCN